VIAMIIGDRIRSIREEQNLSQGDIQTRTGLFRCYVSRVENGHTIPSVETLEKFARALAIPVYRFFYEGKQIPDIPSRPPGKADDVVWGTKGKDILVLNRLRSLLGKMEDNERRLLLHVAEKMTHRTAASAERRQKVRRVH
jgi:transcriptional regulator with XRE-family HTH domain